MFPVLMVVALSACSKPLESSVPPTNVATPASSPGPTSIVKPSPTPFKPTPTPYSTPVPAPSVALIWNGNGVCKEDCAVSAVNAAKLAGLVTRYADNKTLAGNPSSEDIENVFHDVAVWIMPGGDATNEVGAMSTALKTALKNFVSAGGGYVGWGAGAFASTAKIGKTNQIGLGVFPGMTAVYKSKAQHNRYGATIEKTTWFNDFRFFYLEGGPALLQAPPSVEVVSRYDDQVSIAAARTVFGEGRVYVSGTSPEAPKWWWDGTGITDADGTDEAFAAQMIRWAAHLDQ